MKNKYDSHIEPKLAAIEGWARQGLSEEQIAANLGVAYSTFRCHKSEYPALSAALKVGREVADFEVENALYKRATGYEYTEITREFRDGELIVTKTVQKEVVPDTTAQVFWLQNRMSDVWKDKRNVNLSGAVKTGDFEIVVQANEQTDT